MVQRIACCMALVAFAVCLLVGGVEVDNPFTTTVERALVAMFTTLFIGLLVGQMARIMLDENLRMVAGGKTAATEAKASTVEGKAPAKEKLKK